MVLTRRVLGLLLAPGLAAATAKQQCGSSVSSTADASLTKWIQDTEANVSTGSYHVVFAATAPRTAPRSSAHYARQQSRGRPTASLQFHINNRL